MQTETCTMLCAAMLERPWPPRCDPVRVRGGSVGAMCIMRRLALSAELSVSRPGRFGCAGRNNLNSLLPFLPSLASL